jgi:hypothetical protein
LESRQFISSLCFLLSVNCERNCYMLGCVISCFKFFSCCFIEFRPLSSCWWDPVWQDTTIMLIDIPAEVTMCHPSVHIHYYHRHFEVNWSTISTTTTQGTEDVSILKLSFKVLLCSFLCNHIDVYDCSMRMKHKVLE